jgi:hypothetical protein
MKKIRILAVAAILSTTFMVGCGGPNATQELSKKVMAVHDEVMPRMDEMHQLSMQLKAVVDSLKADTMQNHTGMIVNYTEAAANIEQASEGMMSWMRSYNPAQGEQSVEEYNAYLETELVNISQVKDAMLRSIDEANKLLHDAH